MTDSTQVFLSDSHNDQDVAVKLRAELDHQGLSVFWDKESIREGDLWLSRLQDAVEACDAFIVLVGRDGVGRWVGAETQVALNRYFGPHDEAERLPIFPVLLGDTSPETLPAFLKLFQAQRWNGTESLPASLLEQIRDRVVAGNQEITFEGCPFVGYGDSGYGDSALNSRLGLARSFAHPKGQKRRPCRSKKRVSPSAVGTTLCGG